MSDTKSANSSDSDKKSICLNGIPASPGIVIGEAYVLSSQEPRIIRKEILRGDIDREVCRFNDAIKMTRKQILELKERLRQKVGKEEARIFDSHLLVLEDALAIDKTIDLIRKEKVSAEFAFSTAISEVIDALMEVKDIYLRERAVDIRDVKMRIINNLLGYGDYQELSELKKRCVIVANELSPSMTARADRHQLLGIVTDVSGTTSHAAILAQSFEIPAVVGLGQSTEHIKTGDQVIVDGTTGTVIVTPSAKEIENYEDRIRRFREFEDELATLKDLPATTIDGYKIALAANMEFPEELVSVISHGAEGIGLFRTEYLFMTSGELPGEEEQFQIFKKILEGVAPGPAVIRTFDVGADKRSEFFEIPWEKNPFLGWRGIRLALGNEEIFKAHLRALLRASPYGNLHLLFPMISSIAELESVYSILGSVEEELKKGGHEIDPNYQKGVMIETPSSVFIADHLAEEVDFFSIGTNDMIQYMLAVDRGNERVAHLYDPFHPAVIRSIREVVVEAKNRGKWVGVCGEMAGVPSTALLLIGLGIDELSTSPIMVPKIKQLIRSITINQARDLAREVLKMKTSEEIRVRYENSVRELLGDTF